MSENSRRPKPLNLFTHFSHFVNWEFPTQLLRSWGPKDLHNLHLANAADFPGRKQSLWGSNQLVHTVLASEQWLAQNQLSKNLVTLKKTTELEETKMLVG